MLKKFFAWIKRACHNAFSVVDAWYDMLPKDYILNLVIDASTMVMLKKEERKSFVFQCVKKRYPTIPDSVLNCLIEIAYQKFRGESNNPLPGPGVHTEVHIR